LKSKFTYLADATDSTSIPEAGTATRHPAKVEDYTVKGASR